MLVQEHLIQVLLVVERVLSLEEFIELVDGFVKGFNVLILDIDSEFIAL